MSNYLRKTWGCGSCGYSQDFDPGDNELWAKHITSDPYLQKAAKASGHGMPSQGKCVACWLGLTEDKIARSSELYAVSDLSSPTSTTVATDDELESREVQDTDANGQPIMEQTGSRWELAVDQATGKVGSVEVPVYEPKMRSLTDEELVALKEQRNRNLDALESVAVKEVTD